MAMAFHILFITDRFPPQVGGVAISSERLTRLLAERGHVVHVLHLGANVEPASAQSQREGDVMVHRLGVLESPDVTLQLADNVISHLHERVDFQIFHGHYLTPSGYLAAFYAKTFGAKSFVSVRGNDVDRGMFNSNQLPFILWTLQHADAIGCVSRELARKCNALSGRDDIHYTPNSVDLDLFQPQAKDEQLLQSLTHQGETLLGFVGELRFKKGTHFLLDAFRVVREKRAAKLLIVGGMRREDRSFLRHYLRQHPDLRPDIHLVEYVHDRRELVKYYSLMDIVLAPSLWDGMPNSVLEAMACGRLVIASNVGGIRDVITHGETGLLVDVHELHRLGEGCLEVMKAGEEVRTEIGQRARGYVEQHHTPEQEVRQLTEIYANLMKDERCRDAGMQGCKT
jgi:glycosyltransferase involved in cell wall biosynthesis